MNGIYETKGRAREYCELAINLYTGCGHMCIYCYGAQVTHQDKEQWDNHPRPRVGIIEQIEKDARGLGLQGEKRPVLMCFVTDPYQPIEEEHELTRKAIRLLIRHGLKATILTKAGKLAQRDFDILRPGLDAFATTLTLIEPENSVYWEPHAASPGDRILNLRKAHELGLETWVSCEPVLYPESTLELIKQTHTFVDHYKVGTMNYHRHGKNVDWAKFAVDVKALLERLGKPYYLKKDLARYLPGGEH